MSMDWPGARPCKGCRRGVKSNLLAKDGEALPVGLEERRARDRRLAVRHAEQHQALLQRRVAQAVRQDRHLVRRCAAGTGPRWWSRRG